MTNKLKTLNEIEDFDCYSEEIHEREIVFVRVNDLRAEAIRWIKELRKKPDELAKETYPSEELLEASINPEEILRSNMKLAVENSLRRWEASEQFMRFFNIDKSELKDEVK